MDKIREYSSRARCRHRKRSSAHDKTLRAPASEIGTVPYLGARRKYRLAFAPIDTPAFSDIAEYRRRLDGSRSLRALTRAAQPALTVLDVRRPPVMLSVGRSGNHPGDTADRRRIAGGERPLHRVVDIALALPAVRMLLPIPAAHNRLHGAEDQTGLARIRLSGVGTARAYKAVGHNQHRRDSDIPPARARFAAKRRTWRDEHADDVEIKVGTRAITRA